MIVKEPEQHTPQLTTKRQAILRAATEMFLEAGYGATTMDEIATRARVSKQTIYHHFGSKDVLFGAMVEDRCERFLEPIANVELASDEIVENLRTLGRNFLNRVLSPSSLALHRLVVAESNRFPDLGRLSYEAGPRRVVERLARFLEARAERCGLSIPEPEIAAEQFFGALLGLLQLEAILCNEPERCVQRIDGYVDHAVTVFLKGHRHT